MFVAPARRRQICCRLGLLLCTIACGVTAQTSITQATPTSTNQIATTTSASAGVSTAATTTSTSAVKSTSTTSTILIFLIVIPVILVLAGIVKKVLKHRATAKALKNAKTSNVTNNYYMHSPPAQSTLVNDASMMQNDLAEKRDPVTASTGYPPQHDHRQQQSWPQVPQIGQPLGLPLYHTTHPTQMTEAPKKHGWRPFG